MTTTCADAGRKGGTITLQRYGKAHFKWIRAKPRQKSRREKAKKRS